MKNLAGTIPQPRTIDEAGRLPTALIGLVSLGVLWRFRLAEPLLVTAAGVVRLMIWPLVRGGCAYPLRSGRSLKLGILAFSHDSINGLACTQGAAVDP